MFIFYFITLFLFSCKYYSRLISVIKIMINAKKSLIELKNNNNKNDKKNIKKNISFPPMKKGRKNKINKNKKIQSENNYIPNFNKNQSNTISFKRIKMKDNNPNNIILKKCQKVLKLNDNELNNLPYIKAIRIDNRTYIQYYLSLLKTNHLLIFSFYIQNNDYNSQIIKIFLFFFLFSLHLTINALFFNDETMHKILIDKGSYNFLYQMPQIIYSSLISAFITKFIKYLALSEKQVLEIKNENKDDRKKSNLDIKFKKLKKKLKIKFIIFFIISFLLLLLFGFYIICFFGIYIKTQIHLIKDTGISFILPLIYPFGIYLLPGIFRLSALHDKKKDKECRYKFSSLLQSL